MKKLFIKTISLTFAIGVLSLVGFNPAFGYGGGGGGNSVSHCSNVVYGEWGACANGFQYRNVLSQTPKYCTMTASQQLTRSRECLTEVPVVSEEETVVEAETPVVEGSVLGERKYAEGTLLRGSDNKIYVVVGGVLKHILNFQELMKYSGREILNVGDDEIASFDKGEVLGVKKYADGALLRGSDKKVYLLVGGKKKHILNLQELMNYAGQEILNVADEIVNEIENA